MGTVVWIIRQRVLVLRHNAILRQRHLSFRYFLNFFDLSALVGCWSSVSIGEKKEETLLSPMTKAPSPKEKSKKQRDNTKTTKKT